MFAKTKIEKNIFNGKKEYKEHETYKGNMIQKRKRE